ncbi:hypothetical protein OHA_1_01179 [Pleomorphomonas sp. SM30]|uniref:Uncharacterized protein n=2 Tax=Oharaeibacter diazotrophicus TaxID=1920512 RepID=A0A4R6RKI7_9HYPH|nr:hypothetical protein EDD54_0332 [Oharaeibacter diazotrophicus]BBE71601.1 hypothetical protein OHA_1_01179 [Pleomorphomonas sp. SM30]GLS78363.1 hypothetical protein GCM10007904_37000 [Oharaeibacter diazotrophicus]
MFHTVPGHAAMSTRLIMAVNGLAVLAGVFFWSSALAGRTAEITMQDRAVGYLLLTVVRGY